MAQYRFPLKVLNGLLLREQLTAAGFPEIVQFSLEAGAVVVDMSSGDLTAGQQASLAAVIASHDHTQQTAAQQAEAVQAQQRAAESATLDTLIAKVSGGSNLTQAELREFVKIIGKRTR